MRTTIDVPIHIRQQLSQEASSRKLKGFSKIIIEALEKYFNSKSSVRKATVCRLKGTLSSPDHTKAIIDSYNEVMKNSIARMPDLTTSNRRLWINYNSDNISYYIKSTGAGVS